MSISSCSVLQGHRKQLLHVLLVKYLWEENFMSFLKYLSASAVKWDRMGSSPCSTLTRYVKLSFPRVMAPPRKPQCTAVHFSLISPQGCPRGLAQNPGPPERMRRVWLPSFSSSHMAMRGDASKTRENQERTNHCWCICGRQGTRRRRRKRERRRKRGERRSTITQLPSEAIFTFSLHCF